MWFFKKKEKTTTINKVDKPVIVEEKKIDIDYFLKDEELTEEEKDLVATITSCIVADDQSLSQYRIGRIKEIDTDKEMAAVLVSTLCAHDKPQSQFRLVKIEEEKLC